MSCVKCLDRSIIALMWGFSLMTMAVLVAGPVIELLYPTEMTCNRWDYHAQPLSEHSTACKCRAFEYAKAPGEIWQRAWDTTDEGCPYSAVRQPETPKIVDAYSTIRDTEVLLARADAVKQATHSLHRESNSRTAYAPSMGTNANSPDDAGATNAPSGSGAKAVCVTLGQDGQGEGGGKGGDVEINGVKIAQDGCVEIQGEDGKPYRFDVKSGNGGHAYGGGKAGKGGSVVINGRRV